jgi:uncharacterized protein HemX
MNDRLDTALERVALATEQHGDAMDRLGSAHASTAKLLRAVLFAVLGLAAILVTGSVVQQYRQTDAIDSLRDLAVEVRSARDEARGAREDARTAAQEASDAREEIQARQLIVEAPQPSGRPKEGQPSRAILRIPARPATSTAPAAPSAAIPITIGGSSGAGP